MLFEWEKKYSSPTQIIYTGSSIACKCTVTELLAAPFTDTPIEVSTRYTMTVVDDALFEFISTVYVLLERCDEPGSTEIATTGGWEKKPTGYVKVIPPVVYTCLSLAYGRW